MGKLSHLKKAIDGAKRRVYQGSPHKYDGKLDHSKIGTGEGAQAYGYGHYLAEAEDVGKSYMLADRQRRTGVELPDGRIATTRGRVPMDATPEEIAVDALTRFDGNKTEAIAWLDEYGIDLEARNWINKNIKGDAKIVDTPGYLYEFDLPESAIDNMLDWDAPLSEQPEGVRKALEKTGYVTNDGKGFRWKSEALGEDIYDILSSSIYAKDLNVDVRDAYKHKAGDQEAVSKYLNSLGIPGVKYHDGMSRAAGEGTRNFVIFPGNEDMVKAVSRNGEKLSAAALAPLAGIGLMGTFSEDSQAGVGGTIKAAGKALDMSEAARKQRARDMGFDADQVYYHGSTHDIREFGGTTGNPEGHFGSSNYLTTSPDDASRHYAGEGPDLTIRIQQRAEQIASELDLDYDDPKALAMARQQLKGANEGVVYPLRAKTSNPFDISSDGDTFLDYSLPVRDASEYMDEAALSVYESDYVDAEDYADALKERAEELAVEDSYNFDPEGPLVDFIESIRYSPEVDNADEVINAIQERALDDGGISGRDLDEIMRNQEWYASGPEGELTNNEVYRQALEDAGYDSIIHDADIFSGMDAEPGTKHVIVFDPKNIRSVNAAFDPAKKNSADLLASVGGAGVLGAAALSPEDARAAELEAIALYGEPERKWRPTEKRNKWKAMKSGLYDNLVAPALEGMAAVNRGAVDTLNFVGPDQVNAILQLSGSEKRVPTLNNIPGIDEATAGNYMQEGLPRDIVRTGGEFLSPL